MKVLSARLRGVRGGLPASILKPGRLGGEGSGLVGDYQRPVHLHAPKRPGDGS